MDPAKLFSSVPAIFEDHYGRFSFIQFHPVLSPPYFDVLDLLPERVETGGRDQKVIRICVYLLRFIWVLFQFDNE